MAANEGEKTDEASKPLEFGEVFIIGPKVSYSAVVIFLHGLGDTGKGWKDSFQYFSDQSQYIRFIFPTAPVMPVTVQQGNEARAWHDIDTLNARDMQSNKFKHRDQTFEYIKSIIDEVTTNEKNPIPLSRIILAGFSQGAAMALYTGLLYPLLASATSTTSATSSAGLDQDDQDPNAGEQKSEGVEQEEEEEVLHVHNDHFGGLVMLSGYCPHLSIDEKVSEILSAGPNCEERKEKFEKMKQDMPIFMGHGNQDLIVDKEFGIMTQDILKKMGFEQTSWNMYDVSLWSNLGHNVSADEMYAVKKFITNNVPDPNASSLCNIL